MRGQTGENRYGNEFGTRAYRKYQFLPIAVHLMARSIIFKRSWGLSIVRCKRFARFIYFFSFFFFFLRLSIQDLDANKRMGVCTILIDRRSQGNGCRRIIKIVVWEIFLEYFKFLISLLYILRWNAIAKVSNFRYLICLLV